MTRVNAWNVVYLDEHGEIDTWVCMSPECVYNIINQLGESNLTHFIVKRSTTYVLDMG